MSKIGEFMLKETTRTSLTLANFLILIGTVVTIVYAGTMWKAQTEASLERLEARIEVNESEDSGVIARVEKLESTVIESQTTLAEIQTDLKWIRAYMEKDK